MNGNGVDPNKHPGCVTLSFVFIGICNVMGLVFLFSGMDTDRFFWCGLAFFFALISDTALVFGFFKDLKFNHKKTTYYNNRLYDEREAAKERQREREEKENEAGKRP